jgi:hypothetical protein
MGYNDGIDDESNRYEDVILTEAEKERGLRTLCNFLADGPLKNEIPIYMYGDKTHVSKDGERLVTVVYNIKGKPIPIDFISDFRSVADLKCTYEQIRECIGTPNTPHPEGLRSI